MKKRLLAFVAALALTLAAVGAWTAPALADSLQTVKIDVDADNGDYGDYKIEDDKITLLKTDVLYELSGETERQVLIASAGAPDDEYFYLRLNETMLGGGIAAEDQDNSRLAIQVPDGTTSNVETIDALSLWISGGGSLYAESINVGATNASASTAWQSYLGVKDTQVVVQRDPSTTGSCVWMGTAELSGNASVTYISANDYAPLRVVNTGGFDEAVIIKDNAKLFCLQADPDALSGTFVDGLQVQRGKLLLQDNAYLQAEARPFADGLEGGAGLGGEGGAAVFCGGDIEVKDNARIQADAYGWAINTETNMTISGEGASVEAHSKKSQGIYIETDVSVSGGAFLEATGKFEALRVLGQLSIESATLDAKSETLGAVASDKDIIIKNSTVQGAPATGSAFISAVEGVTIDESLVTIAEDGVLGATPANSIVFVGGEGTVYGDAALPSSLSVEPGQTLTVPAGASLTIPDGITLTNNGTIHVLGAINNEGTLECNSHSGGKATCASRAVCEVCHAEYGELDLRNHAHGLKLVEAVAATKTSEGNVAYWYCADCGKCFSDEAGANEISRASTVTPKLTDEGASGGKKAAANAIASNDAAKKTAARRIPATGEENPMVPVAAVALLGGIAVLGSAVAVKRR